MKVIDTLVNKIKNYYTDEKKLKARKIIENKVENVRRAYDEKRYDFAKRDADELVGMALAFYLIDLIDNDYRHTVATFSEIR